MTGTVHESRSEVTVHEISFSVQQGDTAVRVTVLSFLVQVASTDKHIHFLPQFSTAITNKASTLCIVLSA